MVEVALTGVDTNTDSCGSKEFKARSIWDCGKSMITELSSISIGINSFGSIEKGAVTVKTVSIVMLEVLTLSSLPGIG